MEISIPLNSNPPRRHDIPIMELFVNQKIQPKTLRILNEVRMSKEAVWLSDLAVAHGNRLSNITMTTKRFFSSTKWPTHAPINSSMMTSWTSSIQQTVIDSYGGNPLSISRKLGPWNNTPGL